MLLTDNLELDRCPHCMIDRPNLYKQGQEVVSKSISGEQRRWATYYCGRCGGGVIACSRTDNPQILEFYPSTQMETFEFEYLEDEVAEDFREALSCYSNHCYNAFAAMCRRTIQSTATILGAKGKDKVLSQIKELKEIADIDDDTFEILHQVVIAGHDGAHPHLPKLSSKRAAILLVLMKDVLNELFVRKAKVQKAMELRLKEIKSNKSKNEQ